MNVTSLRVGSCALAAALIAGSAHAQLVPNPTLTVQGAGLSVAIGGTGLSPIRVGAISVNVVGPVQAAFLYWNGDGAGVGPQELLFGGSLFLGVDSKLGPVYLGYGRSQNGHSAWYLYVGSSLEAR